MLSCMRNTVVPVPVRRFLHRLVRRRRSARPSKSQRTSKKDIPGPVARPANEIVATHHSVSHDLVQKRVMPEISSSRFDTTSSTASTTTTMPESSVKTTGALSPPIDSINRPPSLNAEVVDQAAYGVVGQALYHTANGSNNLPAFNLATKSTKDSGYASEIHSRVGSKRTKMQHVGKQITTKCKNMWRNFSDTALRDGNPDEMVDNNLSGDLEGSTTALDSTVLDGSSNSEYDSDEDSGHLYDDDQDDGCIQGPRCDFEAIKATPDELFEALARSLCGENQAIDEVQVIRRTRGTYNFAAIISVLCGKGVERYVARIPGHATRAHWTPEDVYMMEREVQLIEHIRKNTSAPVAEIVHYSTGHTNILGFPYIFMTASPGKPAVNIWYDGNYEDDDVELAFQHADIPSVSTEKKRINFLRSLARAMTEVQSLTFDMAGMPIFREHGATIMGPTYRWNESTRSDKARHDKPAVSTQVYGLAGLTRQYVKLDDLDDAANLKHHGALKCFSILFGQSVFKPTQPETFTIHHTDLDLQNIFVDDEGNVTGIIDWDNAFAAPRCIGAASAPLFLQKDWLPDYLNNLDTGPHMGWKTHSYREIYAAALLEAGNPDAIYTTKSALYRAAFMAAWDFDNSLYDFVDKMLREIPQCRIKADDFMSSLGRGWKDAENMLKVEFAKILEPQLPRANLLTELDADIAMKEWFSTFDDYLVEDEVNEEADSDSEDDEGDEASDSGSEGNQDEMASGSVSEGDEYDVPSDSDGNAGGGEATSESSSDGHEDEMSLDFLHAQKPL